MIIKETVAGFFLGLLVFGLISETFIKEQEKIQHEPIKVQVTYPYTLNPISVSGTASTVSGPITFTKV